MAVQIHYVEIGLFSISPNGTVYNLTNDTKGITLQERLTFRSEHRILVDSAIANTANNPTMKQFLTLEAADGFTLAHMSQYIIVTQKVT